MLIQIHKTYNLVESLLVDIVKNGYSQFCHGGIKLTVSQE